jgi:hypothetical protein
MLDEKADKLKVRATKAGTKGIIKLTKAMFNEKAERINGWAAMLGIVAAMGAYALTGQVIPGVW